MVISADMDGLLSAALLHHRLGWRVAGYYDCATLWLSQEWAARREQLVWVDLDMAHSAGRAVGHHILSLTGSLPAGLGPICNPNLLAGIGRENFGQQYPFSTVLFLLWLHDVPLRRSLMARLLVLHAGSSWLNAQSDGENCRQWQARLPGYDWSWLFHQVNSDQFRRRMQDQLWARIERLVGAPPDDAAARIPTAIGNQLQFNPDWDEDLILGMWDLAGTHLKWSPPKAPPIAHRLEGRRSTARLKATATSLPPALRSKDLFSYAITSRDTINFTRLDWTVQETAFHAGAKF